jgi:DUF2075 family protein
MPGPDLVRLFGAAQFSERDSIDTARHCETNAEAIEPPYRGLARSGTMPTPSDGFDFKVFSEPESWEESLRQLHRQGNSVRLLASYAREWKTEGTAAPHDLPGEMMDFHEEYVVAGRKRYWSRIWNYVPQGTDYTWYVTGHPAGKIAADPFCEVGCPYAVRGFDYDYVGIIWLEDLIWVDGSWKAQTKFVKETGLTNLVSAAEKELVPGADTDELLIKVAQAYRILLSRALKGAYIWVPDHDTREYILRSLG